MSDGWRDLFEERGGRSSGAGTSSPSPRELDDVELAPDLSVYRPWTLQRGRSRPVPMLELRRYEQRSGLWMGWQLSYPSLIAAEYIGDRLLSLDFGQRQFVIEGRGLDELALHLQQASVISVNEHAAAIWPVRTDGPLVTKIARVTAPPAFDA